MGEGGRHSAQARLEATGERVQVYARDLRLSPDAPLVRLERGHAEDLRPAALAGHLVCPIPGCEDPRYTTRAGSKRDHFAHRHLVGAPHAPESWFHYTAKQLVGAWVRERYPDADVWVDHEAVENRQIPDVLARFPDGRRFAFEIQYAALTVEDWTERHAGYASQDITDVWLFGHLRRYLRPSARDEGRYALGPLLRAIAEAGSDIFWINPDEQTVGTRRTVTDSEYGSLFAHAPMTGVGAQVGVDALADCRIDGRSFLTPTAIAERARRDQIERERLAAERRREEAEARWREKIQWVAQKKAREAEIYRDKIRPWVDRDLAAAIGVIEVELPADRGIYLHPAHWHALLFRDLVEGHVGQTFTFARACGPFMDLGKRFAVFNAIAMYLRHLRRAGYVDFEEAGRWIASDIEVVADSRNASSN